MKGENKLDNLNKLLVGTSLIENYIEHNPEKENITKADILSYYEKESMVDLRDKRFGSEIIAVENLREKDIFSGRHLFMITHDTVNGRLAGEVLEEFFLSKGIVRRVTRKAVEKMNKRNPDEFRTKGLRNLVEEVGDIVEQVGNNIIQLYVQLEVIQLEIFMVSLMAQILGIKSYFMFREFEDVTEIPPLPIKIDYNYYQKIKSFQYYFK